MSLQSQIDILALGICDLYKKINDHNIIIESGSGCNCNYELNINNISKYLLKYHNYEKKVF